MSVERPSGLDDLLNHLAALHDADAQAMELKTWLTIVSWACGFGAWALFDDQLYFIKADLTRNIPFQSSLFGEVSG